LNHTERTAYPRLSDADKALELTERTAYPRLSDADKALELKTLTTRCIHIFVHFTSVRKHATKHFHIIIIIIII